LVRSVNTILKAAAQDLARMGVIIIEDLDDMYADHRYCESRHTTYKMIDYDTWFWSPYANFNTPSEGPGDPNNPYAAGDEAKRMQTASKSENSSTGTMSTPQQQGSIEEDNPTPVVYPPTTLAAEFYELALEQKQQLVNNPPPLITEDALVSYS
jgi:hypothetical protein